MKDDTFVILCVDDDNDLLDSMKLVLERNGYMMVGAATAEEGLKAYKEHNPDLVIVDLMMEEIDAGTNLVKELKALGTKAPIYMLSSMGDDLNASTDYSELGLSGVLQKPVSHEHLLTIVRAKLQQS